jgi:two-component system sensor histidine kinase TctE
MQRTQVTLRKKILSWFMPLMLLLIIADSTILHRLAVNALGKELDFELYDSVDDISDYLKVSGLDNKKFEVLENASRILLNDDVDKIVYTVTNESGTLLSGNKDLLEKSEHKISTTDLKPYYFFTKINNEKFRVVRAKFKIGNESNSQNITILVAATLNRRNALADKIFIGIFVPQLILILISFLVISISIKKGLAPLNDLQNEVSKRSEKNLSPIDLPNIPEEIFLVAKSVNNLMKQLQNQISVQNRFIADAAHQLRTPLAGAQAQLELAGIKGHPEILKSVLPKVNQSLNRLLHTVNQLLILAKSETEAIAMIKMSQIDLNLIARAVASEMATTAIQKNIDLGFESSATPAFIKGNAERLKELLFNLLDNAIRYTQNGGKVTVSIELTETKVKLKVSDNGPGVIELERDRIFERFHRIIGSDQEGSGLGLAIVKDIADLHGANINMTDETKHEGLEIIVSFSKDAKEKTSI